MPRYLVTYDLEETDPDCHQRFVEEAEQQGLLYVFLTARNDLQRLPATTLWGVFRDRDATRAAFDRAMNATADALDVQMTLEKRVICRSEDSYFRSNQTKRPVERWTSATSLGTCRQHQLHDQFFRY